MAAIDSPYDRVRWWYATTARLRAHEVQRLGPSAWAIRTPRWPASYAHNALVLTSDPGAAQTLAWAEAALDGLPHRQVSAVCPVSDATLAALLDAGYTLQPEVLMARPTSAAPLDPRPVTVEQVDPYAPDLRALQGRLWREEWLPGATDTVVEDLVARRSELDRAGATASYAVRIDGGLVACVDVTMRDGIAEVDGLATLTAFRGRGLAQALMARGTSEAAEAGCDLVVLTALVDDWPSRWYARLGFDSLGQATESTRSP